jgi:hypothetical protein
MTKTDTTRMDFTETRAWTAMASLDIRLSTEIVLSGMTTTTMMMMKYVIPF